ncbi:MAG: T9SS type A sorting domain-containing protein [Candidatus Latescibacterota bacterium]|nr:MAG: T9SS type A sorting domain-containing protein [Candidatus Latescibacterota bacterium]
MKKQPHIRADFSRIRAGQRLCDRRGLLIGLLIAVIPFVLSAGGPQQPHENVPLDRPKLAASSHQVIGPGEVRLTVTRDGRWVEFAPTWDDGRNLITTGGFVVYAATEDGHLGELVNTARGGTRVTGNASQLAKCSEGTKGGFRAPSPDPDDDRDGRVDEDWLDGVDNDGDGRVDEDFAAVGDEMIATSYYAVGAGELAIDGRLVFQQEAYAWSLPHIDGTIMMSLRVKNIGAEALEGVRVGAFFEKEGPFNFSRQSVAPQNRAQAVPTSPTSVLVCEDAGRGAFGLIFFPTAGSLGGEWMGGCLVGSGNPGATVLEQLAKGSIDSFPANTNGSVDGEAPIATADASTDLQSDGPREVGGSEKAVVYGISPSLNLLMPGEEIRIDLAMIAVRESSGMKSAAENAFKTYQGDGANHYLPPPVSMTPRVLWGTYQAIEDDETGVTGVAMDIEPLGDNPITPDDISYFTGIDAGSVVRREIQPGIEKLIVRGETAENLARKGKRIILKGRLEDGEFFEAILRPDENSADPAGKTDTEAEVYWKTNGRLSQDYLNSSPNPFRDVTTVFYEVPSVIETEDGSQIRSSEPLETSVKVYNVVGRLVSVLAEGVVGPGVYTTDWRAVDDNGSPVASGVYYVKLQIGMRYITKRLILLK